MKKLLLLVLIIAAAILWLRRPLPAGRPQASPSPVTKLESINYQDKTYRFAWFAAKDLDNLNLYQNTEAKTSQNLIDTHQCRFLSSGGFYDENNRPLGWLVSDGKELSAPIVSRLFDGFLAISDGVTISFDLPRSVRAGLQSGPMLFFEGKPLTLNIANDELRRRMIALLAGNELIFLTVVGQDSQISGPYLTDLPQLVMAISEKLGWSVSEAINLDGGTASAFYTDKVYLKELNPVGSIFCYN